MSSTPATVDIQSLKQSLNVARSAVDGHDVHSALEALGPCLERVAEQGLLQADSAVAGDLLATLKACNVSVVADRLMERLEPHHLFAFGSHLVQLAREGKANDQATVEQLMHECLDLLRRPPFLQKISGDEAWEELILDLVRLGRFDVRVLFAQRARDHAEAPLFKVLGGGGETDFAWNEVAQAVDACRRGLHGLLDDLGRPSGRVAFLLENSLDMAQLDLACLTSGIVNVMIPVSSPSEHIALILNETRAPVLLVSDDRQLSRVKTIQGETPHLENIVLVSGASAADDVLSYSDLIARGGRVSGAEMEKRRGSPDMDALATIMYTSGTTGKPKGITFTHTNIIYKRFCRALALPQIGAGDRFLCYLPLFHTFGRWLEMMGCVFWGATYTFLENPGLDTIVHSMRQVEPTVFISIPKKWHQLYERIAAQVDTEVEEDEVIAAAVKELTGGELRWGLSAAGFLPEEVFRFFQRYGVELMSGFGMTEATGGITMTPPGGYRSNSLGVALPGIDIELAEDGELRMRGAYVTPGYFGDTDEESPFVDGWLPSGDIMRMDEDGFIEIIDRKKEIYKNSRGETIAPQRIENYLAQFDAVSQVFLVGDRRPFNTLIIHPDLDADDGMLRDMDTAQRRSYFASLIVSVNKFLMPFERIVDFRLIDRPFTAEKGELTPKGTFKRRRVEKSFDGIISAMYAQTHSTLIWYDIEIRVPNWFLRENGCLLGDVVATPKGISIPKLQRRLKLARISDDRNELRIGDFIYALEGDRIDLQRLLTDPFNWLGNWDLFHFVGKPIITWYRAGTGESPLRFIAKAEARRVSPEMQQQLWDIIEAGEHSLLGLHLAVLHLQSVDEEHGLMAVEYLRSILEDETGTYRPLALDAVFRPGLIDRVTVRRVMLRMSLRFLDADSLQRILDAYLDLDPHVLDGGLVREVAGVSRSEEHLDAVESVLEKQLTRQGKDGDIGASALPALFDLLIEIAAQHPTRFRRVRRLVVQYQLLSESEELAKLARGARQRLLDNRRKWLGENESVAVDVETGEEYHWRDVVSFEEGIDDADRDRILRALEETCLVRESISLFSQGRLIALHDLPRGGVWVSHLGTRKGKSVYRVKIQTRHEGSHDLALNLNKYLPREEVREEVDWLIAAGAGRERVSLVEELGGYWEELDLWSEEYVPGDTVAKFLRRKARKKDEKTTRLLAELWPYFVWSAAEAFAGLLKRTGFRMELAAPSPHNIIVPPHDYQTGMRLVSISERIPFRSLSHFLQNFYDCFVRATEDQYPVLRSGLAWRFVFAGLVEAEGEEAGLEALHELRRSGDDGRMAGKPGEFQRELDRFLAHAGRPGFAPKRLYFAVARFHRWFRLNRDADLSAQARTLSVLYDTYGLRELEAERPETRTRFFLGTAFSDSPEPLRQALAQVVETQRKDNPTTDEVLDLLSAIQQGQKPGENEAFFLARISYPHLRPTDSAELLRTVDDGAPKTDLVMYVEDHDGIPFSIRRPISPKEISRLYQLFYRENLRVDFRSEHRFLVAVSERGHLVGGLFYLPIDAQKTYMEKVVVSNQFRRKGVGEALMQEFFNRMRDGGVRHVTTGFFRPEYFYRLGFKVRPRYAGLVREL